MEPFANFYQTDLAQEESEDGQSHLSSTILVINRNVAMREYLRKALDCNYKVEEAVEDNDGLRLAKQILPDLIIMDVHMPEMDGLEATAAIREMETGSGARIPIVAMTAHAMKGDRERCLAAGMDAYVSKPIRAEELFAVIGQLTVAPAAAPAEADGACQELVLNRAEALDRVGGDEDLFRELATVFLDQSPRWLSAIRQALDGQDAAQLKAAAHPLKGSLGTFAAPRAVAAAQRLETLGRHGDLTGGREALADLEREMARLEPALLEIARGCRPNGQTASLPT
jgi:CheY-like chemotaxis protein